MSHLENRHALLVLSLLNNCAFPRLFLCSVQGKKASIVDLFFLGHETHLQSATLTYGLKESKKILNDSHRRALNCQQLRKFAS